MNTLIKGLSVLPFSAKKLLSMLALSTSLIAVSTSAVSTQLSYENLSKQLTIMNNIFKSSLQAQENKKLRSSKVDSLYLAGQGVVFTVNSATTFSWGQQHFFIPDAVAPIAPVQPNGSNMSFEYFNDEEEIVIHLESEQGEQQEHYHELREEQRDLAYELRDLARASKDLAYQFRHVDKAEQAKLEIKQKSLKEQKVALEKEQVKLTKKTKHMQVQQQKQYIQRQQQRVEYHALLTTTLIDTLCLYGNSLKALPNNEHVSLIIKLAGDKTERSGYKDKIYVFNKKDISACANDNITTAKLSSIASSYQF